MSEISSIAKDWMPPIFTRLLRNWRGGGIRFEGEFETWEEAAARCTGYDAELILDKVLDATLKVKRGEAVFERDSVLFDEIEYAWSVTAGLMWAAARSGGRLVVLDFGGSLGSSYFQNRRFLESLSDVRWNVVEQEHYVKAGKKNIQNERLRFYKTIEDCLIENLPNVILFSSVLQYLPSPIEAINAISKSGAHTLLIDRTPISDAHTNTLLVQHVPKSIYAATYPMWVFSRAELLGMLERDWCHLANNISPEGTVVTDNGIEFTFEGILLDRRQ